MRLIRILTMTLRLKLARRLLRLGGHLATAGAWLSGLPRR